MTSKHISQSSALLLFVEGAVLLFAPELIVVALVPGFPREALWLGQLVGAGWLGIAQLNWMNRSAMLGGIYGRPVVAANVGTHMIGAFVLIDAAADPGSSPWMWLFATPAAILAVTYGWLMFRGPIANELEARARSHTVPGGA